NPSGDSYGFFDVAEWDGAEVPVLGMVQEMKFDTAKCGSPDRVRREVRQFVLAYLMRVSSFRRPDAYAGAKPCIPANPERTGFGYSQYFYKPFGGDAAAFPSTSRRRIVDLREYSTTYEWVLMRVKLYSFNLRFSPLGTDIPNLIVPLSESTYLVVNRDFVIDESVAREGSIGRYGFGYALVENP